MFSPDVWSFDPPNTLITQKYADLNEKSMKNVSKRIHSHPFNKLVSSDRLRAFSIYADVRTIVHK